MCAVHEMWYDVNEVLVVFGENTLLCPWALSSFFSGLMNGNLRDSCSLCLSFLYCCFNYTINSTGYTLKFSSFWFSCSDCLGVPKQWHLGHDHSCSFPSRQIFQLYSVMYPVLQSLAHSWGKLDMMQGSMRSFSVRLSSAVCPCGLICIPSSSPFVPAKEQRGQSCHIISGTANMPGSPCARYCLCRSVTMRERTKSFGSHCRIPMFSPVPVMAFMGQSFKLLK